MDDRDIELLIELGEKYQIVIHRLTDALNRVPVEHIPDESLLDIESAKRMLHSFDARKWSWKNGVLARH